MAAGEPEQLVSATLGAADYDEILALWQRAGLPVRLAGRDAPGEFARQMAGGRQRVIGLRLPGEPASPPGPGGRLVAVALLTDDGRKGWINRLAVEPDWRRRGAARRLVAEAERVFREELGLEVFAALIEAGNDASLATFAALGYADHGVHYVSRRARPDA
jgi:GNAT superfamily N-acetyltransferase